MSGSVAVWAGVAAAFLAGGSALWVGIVANIRARQAKDLGAEANAIAREAIAISDLAAQRATERNDVVWTHRLANDPIGHFVLRNVGVDTARRVTAVVSIDDAQQVAERDSVEHDGLVEFDFPEVGLNIEKGNRRFNELLAASIFTTPGHDCTISARIFWETPLGAPRQYVIDEFVIDSTGTSEV